MCYVSCNCVVAVYVRTYLYPGNICSSRSESCLKPRTMSLNEGSYNQKQVNETTQDTESQLTNVKPALAEASLLMATVWHQALCRLTQL